MTVPVKSLWFMLTGDMDIWTKTDGLAGDAFKKAYLGGGSTPRYAFVWMPAIDHLGHFNGSKAQVIYDRAKDVDNNVGRIMDILQKANIYDKTLVSLVADHGLSDTSRHLDIKKVLEGYGLNVMGDLKDNDQFNSLHQNNAARGVSGNSFAMLYFAKARKGRLDTKSYAWDQPTAYQDLRNFPTGSGRVDLLDEISKEEGMGFAIAKEGANTYHVFGRQGVGRIERDYSSFRYTFTGSDPLGYAELPETSLLMDGALHEKDAWFMASRKSEFPDSIFQISQLFDSERCGDIVVVAERGWDLMDQGHVASHGGLDRMHISVPCVIAGPGVRHGTIPIARTVDLYPTYLKYLGIPHYDGEVLNVFL
jgi:arylsulfatase A-like enzyme